MIKCGKSVVTHVMNPKSMPRERLLGRMDLDTREWFDGVLTDAARKVVREPSDVSCWVICDGDVDPEWIESINSVLDDNHLLTLPNGERISFGANVNFLFETHDLKVYFLCICEFLMNTMQHNILYIRLVRFSRYSFSHGNDIFIRRRSRRQATGGALAGDAALRKTNADVVLDG